MGLCTITTDKKKKHTKVMIPMRDNNTKIHGPMGVMKEIALHAGDEVVIFCMKFKSCPFKL